MKDTIFYKVPRGRSYILRWFVGGIDYRAYLNACAGKPLLDIEIINKGDAERRIYQLSTCELRERGMIVE